MQQVHPSRRSILIEDGTEAVDVKATSDSAQWPEACPRRAIRAKRRTRWRDADRPTAVGGRGARHVWGVFGGATAYPKAMGIWRDDERDGALIKDEPVVIHGYTTPADIQNAGHLAALAFSAERWAGSAGRGRSA